MEMGPPGPRDIRLDLGCFKVLLEYCVRSTPFGFDDKTRILAGTSMAYECGPSFDRALRLVPPFPTSTPQPTGSTRSLPTEP